MSKPEADPEELWWIEATALSICFSVGQIASKQGELSANYDEIIRKVQKIENLVKDLKERIKP